MLLRPAHRPRRVLAVLCALLYGALTACATAGSRAAESAAPAPNIALILPLNSASFGRHADAVRQGFAAAARIAGKNGPPVRVYSVNEDSLDVLTTYERAVESGAQLVVGPLTRNGVAALAAGNFVTVPTLALNALDPDSRHPARLYLFGLSVELEARQIAQLAFADGRRNAFIVSDDSPLSKRMRDAFVTEFARQGGVTVAEYAYSTDIASLTRLRQAAGLGVADMAFLALDFTHARTVRPYFGNALALYATSQVNAGGGALSARELDALHFVDMPWLLQPDHAAVMVYPHPQFDSYELDRMYALGIDAYRIALELLRQSPDPELDGVSGHIRLGRGQQFVRELTPAQFADGKIIVAGAGRR